MKAEEMRADYTTLTDTGNAASDWHRARLGDIAQVVRGVTYKKEQAAVQSAKDMLPILRATNVQDGALVLDSDLVFVPKELVSETQKLRVGDIVVATSSGSKHLVGKTAQVREAWEGSFGAFCAAIRPTSDIDQRYLGYFFETREYKDYISKKALGVNINNLRRGDLEEMSVPVAPIDQQKRIVAEIEKQFSRLDEAVANLKRVKANLKRYKPAVLNAAVEGRLVETEAELARREGRSFETGAELLQRILETRRSQWQGKGKYKEPAAPDTACLPELPEGWVWIDCDAVLDRIEAGASFKCIERPPTGNETGVLKVSAVTWGVFNELESKTCMDPNRIEEGYLVQEGDFLFSRANTIDLVGACVLVKHVSKRLMLSDKTLRFRISSLVSEEWLLICLRSKWGRLEIESLATGNQESMRNIGQDRIRKIRIPLPPLSEQIRVASEIDRRFSLYEVTQAQVVQNLTRARVLRTSILNAAFEKQQVLQP